MTAVLLLLLGTSKASLATDAFVPVSTFSCSEAQLESSCLRSSDGTTYSMPDQLERVVAQAWLPELTSYVAERVFSSYMMSFLMDDELVRNPGRHRWACSAQSTAPRDRDYVRGMIEAELGLADVTRNAQSDLAAISSCFGFAPQLELLTLSAKTRGCDQQPAPSAISACSATPSQYALPDSGASITSAELDHLYSQVSSLDSIENQEWLLIHQGKLRENGESRTLTCAGYASCESFFEKMEDCRRHEKGEHWSLSKGCIAPGDLREDLRDAWTAYDTRLSALRATRDYIFTQDPELAVEIQTWSPRTGDVVMKEHWKDVRDRVIDGRDGAGGCAMKASTGPKYPCRDILAQSHNMAVRTKRGENLRFLLSMCHDPASFAKHLLFENPELVAQFLNDRKDPSAHDWLCKGRKLAEKEIRRARTWRKVETGVGTAAAVVGVFLTPWTGGASLAAAYPVLFTTAVAGTSLATTAVTTHLAGEHLYRTYERLQREIGLNNGCVGDYARVAAANLRFKEATERAIITGAMNSISAIRLISKFQAVGTSLSAQAEVAEEAVEAMGTDSLARAAGETFIHTARLGSRISKTPQIVSLRHKVQDDDFLR